MKQHQDDRASKLKLAIGAASLFLFVVGLKRSFRHDDGHRVYSSGKQDPTSADSNDQSHLRSALRNAS